MFLPVSSFFASHFDIIDFVDDRGPLFRVVRDENVILLSRKQGNSATKKIYLFTC